MKSLNFMTIAFLFVTTLIVASMTSNYVVVAGATTTGGSTGLGNSNSEYLKVDYLSDTGETSSQLGNEFPPRFVPSQNMENLNTGIADIDAKTLVSNNESKSLGWDPNGSADTFIVFDSAVDPDKSLVLINTIQFNKVTCSVDYLAKGFFEIHCDEPPSPGAALHYMIFNGKISTMATMSSSNITERIQNISSAENITIPRALEQASNLTSANNSNVTNINNGNVTKDAPQNNPLIDSSLPDNQVSSQSNGTITDGSSQNNEVLAGDNNS